MRFAYKILEANKLKLSDIGKVLFIDDDYKTIVDATTAFLKEGIQVQYWKGSGALPSSLFNVRIVVLDLDLTGLGIRTTDDSFYVPAVKALNELQGPFIVIILAREFNPIDPARIRAIYSDKFGKPICGFVADEGLTKETLENPAILEKLIVTLLQKNDVLHLILSWEEIFDKAKDAALSDILLYDVDEPIKALIKLLCKNFGESKATARELIDIMLRLVSRRTNEDKQIDNLTKLIRKSNKSILRNEYPEFEDLYLYSKLLFYLPSPEEDIMTGDIYETPDPFTYAIILSPKCDLIQKSVKKCLVGNSYPLKREYFRNPDYPVHKLDPVIEALHKKTNNTIEDIACNIEDRYFKTTLPDSLFVLWNFSPETGIFGLCLDFNNIKSVELVEVNKWNRISRIDSPYIEEILQKYASNASRIGTLEINRSPFQLQKTMLKMKGKAKEAKGKKMRKK